MVTVSIRLGVAGSGRLSSSPQAIAASERKTAKEAKNARMGGIDAGNLQRRGEEGQPLTIS
jgi:hypothetical protein